MYSPLTSLLITKLRQHDGDAVADEQLEEWTGLSCRSGDRGYAALQSAIRFLEREDRVVWRRHRTTKLLVRLSDPEKLQDMGSRRRHMHRQARRNAVVGGAVDVAKLSHEQRSQYAIGLAIDAAAYKLTDTNTQKRLATQKSTALPDLNNVLAATLKATNGS